MLWLVCDATSTDEQSRATKTGGWGGCSGWAWPAFYMSGACIFIHLASLDSDRLGGAWSSASANFPVSFLGGAVPTRYCPLPTIIIAVVAIINDSAWLVSFFFTVLAMVGSRSLCHCLASHLVCSTSSCHRTGSCRA